MISKIFQVFSSLFRNSFLPVMLIVACAVAASSQTSTSVPPRDAQAVAILQAAMTSLGGGPAIQAIQDLTIQGTCQGGGTTSTILWQLKGNERRFQTTNEGTTSVLLTGHGKPMHSSNGVAQAWSPQGSRAAQTFYAPALVLAKILADNQFALTYLGTEQINRVPLIGVRVTRYLAGIPFGPSDEWWFDPTSGLPSAIVHSVPAESSAALVLSQTTILGSYGAVAGVQFPATLTIKADIRPEQDCSITKLVPNSGLADSIFDSAGQE